MAVVGAINKNDIDWRAVAAHALWALCVRNKNDYSGLDISDATGNIAPFSIMAYIPPDESLPRKLSWKELSLELSLFEDLLTPDGHDCTKCPEESGCKAYFKYDKDHERCNEWERIKERKIK